MSPGEQIKGVTDGGGKIDVAFLDQGDDITLPRFYVRKIDVIPSLVGSPLEPPLARRREVKLAWNWRSRNPSSAEPMPICRDTTAG